MNFGKSSLALGAPLTLSLLLAALLFMAPNGASANPLEASAKTRVRMGIDAGLGAALGDTKGAAFSLLGHLGLQANDLFAIYWQPGMWVDGWAARGDVDVDVYTFMSQMGMIDFSLSRFFQLGAGGGVDFGRFGVCHSPEEGGRPECELFTKELRPAAEARMAVIIPLPGLRARWGLPIVFRAHTTFMGNKDYIHSLTMGVGLMRF